MLSYRVVSLLALAAVSSAGPISVARRDSSLIPAIPPACLAIASNSVAASASNTTNLTDTSSLSNVNGTANTTTTCLVPASDLSGLNVLQITPQARVIHIPLRPRVPRIHLQTRTLRIPLLTRAPRIPLQPQAPRTPLRLRTPAPQLMTAQPHPLVQALQLLLTLIRPQGMTGMGTLTTGMMITTMTGTTVVGTTIAGTMIIRMMMMALLGYPIPLQASLHPTPQIRQGAGSVPRTKLRCTHRSPVVSIAPFYRTIVALCRPTFPPSRRTGKISVSPAAATSLPTSHAST